MRACWRPNANVAVYGYGVKGFTLSMIETAIEVTNGKVDADTIYRILSFAKDQLSHPVELLPGVDAVIDDLAGRYRLLLITKGDLFDQESKIARWAWRNGSTRSKWSRRRNPTCTAGCCVGTASTPASS